MTGPHSDETKARMAAAHKAQWADPEFRAKMKAAHARRSPEERKANAKKAGEAASKVLKGKKRDPEQFKKAVATRRARMGGKYMPNARFVVPMEDEPPPEKQVQSPHSQATKDKIAAAQRRRWQEGKYSDRKMPERRRPASRRRVSQMELALVPFLEALGYQHVDARNKFYIHTPGKGMVPDFVDRRGNRVFEYFGGFWHHPDDEATWIEQYRLAGWDCTVLWECDASQWVEEHRHLVTEEQYDLVRRLIERGLYPY